MSQNYSYPAQAAPVGGATAANQVTQIGYESTSATDLTALNARLSGALVPVAFNEIDLTYVPSGNGAGQVATAVYKLSGSTVATITFSYDGSNRLISTVKS